MKQLKVTTTEKQGEERKITHEEICKSYGIPDIGEFSDGYHTFNGLYKQRMILFAVLVKTYKDRAWKSWKHEDGLDCFGGGWFIVGIDTPAGTYTYHYEAKDWDKFDCQILEKAKHWDGHDEFDVERLFSLVSNANKDEVIRCLINGMKFYYEDNAEATWGTEKFSMKVKDILSWLEKQGEQKHFDYEDANIQQKDFAPQKDIPRYSIGDVLCDKSCTMLNKESQSNFEITDIRNGMYICDKCSFPISQQDEYELVAKRIEQKPAWSEKSINKPNGKIVMEDFNDGNGFYKVNIAYLNEEQVEEIEELVKRWDLQSKGNEEDSIISDLLDYFDEDKCLKHEVNDIVKWLKTIKPQQKGWGENEIKMLDNLITYLDGRKDLLEEIKRTYIDWLKSLKERL